jgi:hypothetical protein
VAAVPVPEAPPAAPSVLGTYYHLDLTIPEPQSGSGEYYVLQAGWYGEAFGTVATFQGPLTYPHYQQHYYTLGGGTYAFRLGRSASPDGPWSYVWTSENQVQHFPLGEKPETPTGDIYGTTPNVYIDCTFTPHIIPGQAQVRYSYNGTDWGAPQILLPSPSRWEDLLYSQPTQNPYWAQFRWAFNYGDVWSDWSNVSYDAG